MDNAARCPGYAAALMPSSHKAVPKSASPAAKRFFASAIKHSLPNVVRDEVRRLVAGHAFWLDGPIDGVFARRFLASHGVDRARRLLLHKRADLSAKSVEPWELEHLAALERLVEEERERPHRLADLAVDGTDLIAAGYREGPELGAALARLLDVVLDDPAANERGRLLEEATSWLS